VTQGDAFYLEEENLSVLIEVAETGLRFRTLTPATLIAFVTD
jgi:hypothetical protein